MSAHDGWVPLDDPPQPERRRPATVPELAAHQASCPECRDPWFANPQGGCPSCDRDLSYPGAPGHECYTYDEWRQRTATYRPSKVDVDKALRADLPGLRVCADRRASPRTSTSRARGCGRTCRTATRPGGVVKPYYADDAVTLYHGDALEILPTLTAGTFAACVTDPPYVIGASVRREHGVKGGRLG